MEISKLPSEKTTEELTARLAAARTRVLYRDALRFAVWSALASVLVLGVFGLLRLAAGAPDAAADLRATGWLAAGLALTAGIAVGAIRLRRSAPDLVEMARRADRHFALDERLSTALEVSRSGTAPASPVTVALVRDANGRASRVDPRSLVPIRLPRSAIALALSVIGVIGLEFANPAAPSAPQPGSAILAVAAGDDATAAAEVIREIASLVRGQAEQDSSEYLRVVATSLDELAMDVAEGEVGGQPVADELARLLEHAEAAAGGAAATRGSNGMSFTLAEIEELLGADGELVARADENTEESSGEEAAPAKPSSLAAALVGRARSALESLRAELGGDTPDSDQPEGDLATVADSVQAEELAAASSGDESMQPAVAAGQRPLANSEVGTAIGGGESDAKGGSAMEGLGGGSPMALAERRELQAAGSSQDFELPTEGGSRRRLPEEIVPQTRLTDIEESALPRGDWQRTPQDQLSSGYLGVSYREVASRYFLSRTREAEAQARQP